MIGFWLWCVNCTRQAKIIQKTKEMSYASIWVIMIAVMVLSFVVQNTLQRRFTKYSKIPTSYGMTGADIAREMLRQNGIT